jgi:hypothetical protein
LTIGQGPTPTRLAAPPRHSDAPPTVAVTTTARRAAAGRGPSRAVPAGGAALVVLVLLAGAWMAMRGSREAAVPVPPAAPTTLSPATASAAPPAPLAASGTLVIDALPWGQVAEVVDASGMRRALGGAPDTPLALELPAGEYTVRVRNPAFADALSITATVKPGAVERRVVEFRRVDAADYFRKTGT